MPNTNPGQYSILDLAPHEAEEFPPLTPAHAAAHRAGLCGCFTGKSAQPSPYSASLPKVEAPAPVATSAQAFDEIEAWISRNPATRSAWAIDKLNGEWRVGLQYDGERLTAGKAKSLAQAARNAIEIATLAGLL